jgi:hypothetical protein
LSLSSSVEVGENLLNSLEKSKFQSFPAVGPDSGNSLALVMESKEVTAIQRLVQVLADSVFALKECRRLDAHDFKSVHKLAAIYMSAATIPLLRDCGFVSSMISWPVGAQAALDELGKLFDKKPSQIVAIWCLEVAATRFEHLNQRSYKFEAIRRKVRDISRKIDSFFDILI